MQTRQDSLHKDLHPQPAHPEVDKDPGSPDSPHPLRLESIFSSHWFHGSSRLQCHAGEVEANGSQELTGHQPSSVGEHQASERTSQKMRWSMVEVSLMSVSGPYIHMHIHEHVHM